MRTLSSAQPRNTGQRAKLSELSSHFLSTTPGEAERSLSTARHDRSCCLHKRANAHGSCHLRTLPLTKDSAALHTSSSCARSPHLSPPPLLALSLLHRRRDALRTLPSGRAAAADCGVSALQDRRRRSSRYRAMRRVPARVRGAAATSSAPQQRGDRATVARTAERHRRLPGGAARHLHVHHSGRRRGGGRGGGAGGTRGCGKPEAILCAVAHPLQIRHHHRRAGRGGGRDARWQRRRGRRRSAAAFSTRPRTRPPSDASEDAPARSVLPQAEDQGGPLQSAPTRTSQRCRSLLSLRSHVGLRLCSECAVCHERGVRQPEAAAEHHQARAVLQTGGHRQEAGGGRQRSRTPHRSLPSPPSLSATDGLLGCSL